MSKWRVRIGYGMGDLGCNLVFSTMASYLMVFYTDVFGIAAAAAGTMMLVTKFIDAMTDTMMGIIVDHTHTRWGQGRPYFLIGAVPFAVFTFSSTKEVVPPTVSNEHMSLKDSFKGLTGQAWILFFLNLFYFSLYVVRNTTVIYYFKYNLDRSDLLALVGLLGILSGLPMLLALPTLEKHFKKRSLMFFSVALYVAGDLLIYFGQSSIFCLLAGLVITGLGIYGIFGVTFAMQPDVIDYSEYKKNRSVAGLIAAFQGFFVKGGMGLTSFVVGLFLNMGGYVPNAVQTASALSAIEDCFIWIPILLCAIIAALIYFYKLDNIRTDMTAELDLRRQILAGQHEMPDIVQAIPQYDPKAKQ